MKERLPAAVAGVLIGFVLVFLFWPSAPHAAKGKKGDVRYACPMYCVVLDEMPESGLCPICDMELTVVTTESLLRPAERRMAGLQASVVKRLPLSKRLRVVGEVDYDESRVARVTTRVAGWLRGVRVDSLYAEVAAGDELASIYSPELYAAEKEYLVARDDPELRTGAARKLELLGIAPEEIEALAEGGEVRESLVLRAPRGGVVTGLAAVDGTAVMKGATLYTIADLSRVWIQAEAFERDLPWLRVGQPVRVSTSDGGPLAARVAFVDPVIDRHSRSARVRIEVDNPAGPDGVRPLRIGQRVDAFIEPPVGDGPTLALPKSAVLRTGERAVAYLLFDTAGGGKDYRLDPERLPDPVHYEMVEIEVGEPARGPGGGEYYPVLPGSGIEVGFTVVTRGNLLLDSQAQLSGKPSLLFPQGNR